MDIDWLRLLRLTGNAVIAIVNTTMAMVYVTKAMLVTKYVYNVHSSIIHRSDTINDVHDDVYYENIDDRITEIILDDIFNLTYTGYDLHDITKNGTMIYAIHRSKDHRYYYYYLSISFDSQITRMVVYSNVIDLMNIITLADYSTETLDETIRIHINKFREHVRVKRKDRNVRKIS